MLACMLYIYMPHDGLEVMPLPKVSFPAAKKVKIPH